MVGPQRFCFLNHTADLALGWDSAQQTKLWRYNLHYFDDLNSAEAWSREPWHRDLIESWIEDNPIGKGTGWEPYPLSLRIVNWIKWAWDGHEMSPHARSSLADQARWLSRRLEHHLRGNHLFTNAKALVFAGLYFDGPEAESWLQQSTLILVREIEEQILSDGGHFERSTMYHALVLEDALDLCNAFDLFEGVLPEGLSKLSTACRKRIPAMRNWLALMCHPDGDISFFNDAAIGIAPSPRDLHEYAARLGFGSAVGSSVPLSVLRESGYIRIQMGGAVAIMDVAPLGPDYLLAHAHADTLSFELSIDGQRTLVNSGTSGYSGGAYRDRERSTSAHNTVTINGESSSEMWATFRVARRAYPTQFDVLHTNDEVVIRGAHDGYRWLKGKPRHAREWHCNENSLTVKDLVDGTFAKAEARFHVHPAVRVQSYADRNVVLLWLPSGRVVKLSAAQGSIRLEPSTFAPRFGLLQENVCIVAEFASAAMITVIEWGAAE